MAIERIEEHIGHTDPKAVVAFNRETYGELIRKARIRCGLSQPQLAERLHTNKNYVSNWEIGRARPDMNIIPELCDALNISINEFFGRKGEHNVREKRVLKNFRRLDERNKKNVESILESLIRVQNDELYEHCRKDFCKIYCGDLTAAAGTDNYLDDAGYGEYRTLRSNELTSQADEIITVSGDSMEPTFYSGDQLLVQRTQELREGEIGIIYINDEGFVKEFCRDGVYSHNARRYPFRKFLEDDDVRCYGRVLGKITQDMYPDAQETAVLSELERETF